MVRGISTLAKGQTMRATSTFLLALMLAASTAFAADEAKPSRSKPAITLSTLFVDHMVLQRDIPVPVWGETAPNTRVSVSFAGQTVKTKSDKDGKWKATLEPLKAGGPFALHIKARRSEAMIYDVLVGDVWVCSGQSNMEWPVKLSNNPEEEIKNANHPYIRLFSVEKKVSGEPLNGCQGKWEVCSPETIPEFTAVGYFFGRTLAQSLKVKFAFHGHHHDSLNFRTHDERMGFAAHGVGFMGITDMFGGLVRSERDAWSSHEGRNSP